MKRGNMKNSKSCSGINKRTGGGGGGATAGGGAGSNYSHYNNDFPNNNNGYTAGGGGNPHYSNSNNRSSNTGSYNRMQQQQHSHYSGPSSSNMAATNRINNNNNNSNQGKIDESEATAKFFASNFVGQRVSVKTTQCDIEGMFVTISDAFVVALENCVVMEKGSGNNNSDFQKKDMILSNMTEVLHIAIRDIKESDNACLNTLIKLGQQKSLTNNSVEMKTDMQITAKNRSDQQFGGGGEEKDLVPYFKNDILPPNLRGENNDDGEEEEEDCLNYKKVGDSYFDPKTMFDINQQKFGVESSYHPDMEEYTTIKLDRNAPDYSQRLEEADRIAREIEAKSAAANRGGGGGGGSDDGVDDMDEEMRFSAVVRNKMASNDDVNSSLTNQIKKSLNIDTTKAEEVVVPSSTATTVTEEPVTAVTDSTIIENSDESRRDASPKLNPDAKEFVPRGSTFDASTGAIHFDVSLAQAYGPPTSFIFNQSHHQQQPMPQFQMPPGVGGAPLPSQIIQIPAGAHPQMAAAPPSSGAIHPMLYQNASALATAQQMYSMSNPQQQQHMLFMHQLMTGGAPMPQPAFYTSTSVPVASPSISEFQNIAPPLPPPVAVTEHHHNQVSSGPPSQPLSRQLSVNVNGETAAAVGGGGGGGPQIISSLNRTAGPPIFIGQGGQMFYAPPHPNMTGAAQTTTTINGIPIQVMQQLMMQQQQQQQQILNAQMSAVNNNGGGGGGGVIQPPMQPPSIHLQNLMALSQQQHAQQQQHILPSQMHPGGATFSPVQNAGMYLASQAPAPHPNGLIFQNPQHQQPPQPPPPQQIPAGFINPGYQYITIPPTNTGHNNGGGGAAAAGGILFQQPPPNNINNGGNMHHSHNGSNAQPFFNQMIPPPPPQTMMPQPNYHQTAGTNNINVPHNQQHLIMQANAPQPLFNPQQMNGNRLTNTNNNNTMQQ